MSIVKPGTVDTAGGHPGSLKGDGTTAHVVGVGALCIGYVGLPPCEFP